ncbi:MAG: hypothetical protein HYX66_08310 [Ignavibacteria bacterium]|nr:hypothetical protein [Ignavibacteria bacterium]
MKNDYLKTPRHLHLAVAAQIFILLSVVIVGCSYTRVEEDVYTLTDIDTTEVQQVHNQPGERDNGVIYPSSRTVVVDRHLTQHDSVVERSYPNFIRLGVFEGIGLIGGQLTGNSTYTGLFGLFYQLDNLLFNKEPEFDSVTLFSGFHYRVGFGEWKLRFFGNDPNWTWGISAFEIIQPDNDVKNRLLGAGVLSIHKRFYFREQIPYFAITPQVSISGAPSPFLNGSVSADLGSIGGLNMRVYMGFIWGVTNYVNGVGVSFPYIGIGTSALDFLNREEELEVEWKYHEHSAWEIGAAEVQFIASTSAQRSVFATDKTGDEKPGITGFNARLLNTRLAIPILDNRLTAGTSIIEFLFIGADEYAVGVLPLRLSYYWQPFGNLFTIEPFSEFSYLPSTFVNLGVRAALPISDNFSIVVTAGYVSGETGSSSNLDATGAPSTTPLTPGVAGLKFSSLYFGFGVSVFDRIFGKKELRYR